MKHFARIALVTVAVAALGGCKIPGFHNYAAPTGQVVATVNGHEVTMRELAAELGDFSTPDPRIRKMAEGQALNAIITRKILAQAAAEEGLDKTPDFALQKERADDTLLASLLERKVASQVPAPTPEEAAAFVTENPDMFSQRKLLVVDQLRMERPRDPAVLKAFEPLKTMAQVQAQLDADHLAYQKGVGTIDSLGVEPKLLAQILKLPPGEIFILPAGQGLQVNQIRDTQIIPFTGPAATQFAQAYLKRQRTQDAVRKQLSAIVGKSASQVKFNKDFQPPARPTAPEPEAPKGE
jgi:EpsD family peptidyl-prolyl cis-trans isomerase